MTDKVYTGEVIWFDPKAGYGFISWEGGEDMFVHFSDVIVEGYKTLKKCQKVTFEVGVNNTGKPKAVEVEVVEDA